MTTPSPEYVNNRLDRIAAAIVKRDGGRVVEILNDMHADGHPETARHITHGLLATAISRAVADPQQFRGILTDLVIAGYAAASTGPVCCPEFDRSGHTHTETCSGFNAPAADPAHRR